MIFAGRMAAGMQAAIPVSAQELENCTNSMATPGASCTDPNPGRVTVSPYQGDMTAANFFDDLVLAAQSVDYTPACAAIAGGGSGNPGGGGGGGIPDHCTDGRGQDVNQPGCR